MRAQQKLYNIGHSCKRRVNGEIVDAQHHLAQTERCRYEIHYYELFVGDTVKTKAIGEKQVLPQVRTSCSSLLVQLVVGRLFEP